MSQNFDNRIIFQSFFDSRKLKKINNNTIIFNIIKNNSVIINFVFFIIYN